MDEQFKEYESLRHLSTSIFRGRVAKVSMGPLPRALFMRKIARSGLHGVIYTGHVSIYKLFYPTMSSL